MCKVCMRIQCVSGCPNYEPKTIGTCEYCDEGIEIGDDYYEYDGNLYHDECFKDVAVTLLLENGASRMTATEDDLDDGSDEAYERWRDERYG